MRSSVSRLLSWCAVALGLLPLSTPARADLVGHWRFDEALGSTIASDSTANHYDGTLFGGSSLVAGGVFGNALSLNGTTGYVSMGHVLDFAAGESFTVSAWVKTEATAGAAVVGNHRSSVSAGYILGVNDLGGGGPNKANLYATSGSNWAVSTASVNDGVAWHLITGTYQGPAKELSIYVDGVLSGSATSTLNMVSSDAPLLVGAFWNYSGSPMAFYSGLIDDVRI
ncbi:MAG: LamG domain-containing protein, partial [Armatimonadota bacterium]|nr:LamG domain-containing protein [Armatimonadota bacterium]